MTYTPFVNPMPVTDNGGSLTVDGAVTVSGTVTATTGGLTNTELRASPVDVAHGLAISRGLVTNCAQFRKFGSNPAVGTSETPISSLGTIWQPTVAVTVEAISTDANDTAAGTGARTMVVTGLDQTFAEVSETLTLNGTSASTASTTTFIRVYRAYVATTGTYAGTNAGAITIRVSGGGTSILQIVAGKGQTQTTMYTVPTGKTLYVEYVNISVSSAKEVDISFYQFPNIDDVSAPFTGAKRLVQLFEGMLSSVPFRYDPPMVFAAKTDLWFAGLVSAGSGAASVEYGGVLVTN